MNAGAYNKEIKDILIKALVIDGEGQLIWLSNEELEFAYRTLFSKIKRIGQLLRLC